MTDKETPTTAQNMFSLGQQMMRLGQQMMANPTRMQFDFKRQAWMAEEFSNLFVEAGKQPDLLANFQQSLLKSMSGQDTGEPKKDRRFSDPAWEQPGFQQLKDVYLGFSDACQELVEQIPEQDEKQKSRRQFFLRQWLSAISPSNYAFTNPVVIERTRSTGGNNLIAGMQHWLDDLETNQGVPNISMTDMTAFEPGVNLATTKGHVVFQNKLMQLIQYSPQTKQVHEKPVLIVPPWINKYYILDLQPKNSMVNWLVSQGHTVFMISWVNPDESYRDVGFDDYVESGVVAALDTVCDALSVDQINAVGYCLGGTLLATSLAKLKAEGDTRVASATFLTTLLDFTFPGEIGAFLSDEQLELLEQQLEQEGVLDGRMLALSYAMLRENDLYWSYHVSNYLLGDQPPAFDLLYWNADATNMPGKMHTYYLKNMYQGNKLKDKNGIEIGGVPIDLGKIDIPCYFLSAKKDHIALWNSTYLGAKLMSGDTQFVLAGSGHVAGVVNPADSGKYSFYTNDALPDDYQDWIANAEQQPGSWWSHWDQWLSKHSSEEVTARDETKGSLKALEPAPGSYVLKKLT